MKMNRHTLIMATAVAAVTIPLLSCSDDNDMVEPAETGGVIRFGAQVPATSRATPTTTATLNNFIVYGFTEGSPYMENVKVIRNGGSWSYSPTMYWPSTPVNFFAFSPDISNAPGISSSGIQDIANYTNTGNVDLLYAVNMNETAREAPVQMNFRHAMSNVRIMTSSGNSAITVKVHHVKLCNVAMRGTFTFPMVTTSASKPENVGSWKDQSLVTDALTFYAMDPSEVSTLSTTPVDLTQNNLDISFMIPQTLSDLTYDGSAYAGSAIQVDCEIFDSASGAKIWPTAATPSNQLVPETELGRLMYPVTTETLRDWKPGYAYVYNIVIDNPSVLHPISFSVTVDEYQEYE